MEIDYLKIRIKKSSIILWMSGLNLFIIIITIDLYLIILGIQ